MPYGGFASDTVVVTGPSADELQALAAKRLPSLTINEYAFDSLQPLGVLAGLEVLKLCDTVRLRSLGGVEALSSLTHLVIAVPSSWEGANRRIDVDSFTPLKALVRLERLILHGVRPKDLDLAPIAAMQHLHEVDIGGVAEFTVEHYAGLAAALPIADGRCLQPYYRLDGLGVCSKCKGQTVLLTGVPVRARKGLCPVCQDKKIAEHVAAWQGFKKAAGSRRARPA